MPVCAETDVVLSAHTTLTLGGCTALGQACRTGIALECRGTHAGTTQHTARLPGHDACGYPPGQWLASSSPPYQDTRGALDHRRHDAHGRTGDTTAAQYTSQDGDATDEMGEHAPQGGTVRWR